MTSRNQERSTAAPPDQPSSWPLTANEPHGGSRGQLASLNDAPVPEGIDREARSPHVSAVELAPREKGKRVVRVERDYSVDAEIPQLSSRFPAELDGLASPVTHLRLINELNRLLLDANDPIHSIFDNLVAILTFYLSTLIYRSYYQRQMARVEPAVAAANAASPRVRYRDPRLTGMLFLEIEL